MYLFLNEPAIKFSAYLMHFFGIFKKNFMGPILRGLFFKIINFNSFSCIFGYFSPSQKAPSVFKKPPQAKSQTSSKKWKSPLSRKSKKPPQSEGAEDCMNYLSIISLWGQYFLSYIKKIEFLLKFAKILVARVTLREKMM